MEYANSQMRALIDDYIHSARDREILTLRLIQGSTYQQIADTISNNACYNPITSRQVYRIVARESAKLFQYLKNFPA